jgi:hypothetical protein
VHTKKSDDGLPRDLIVLALEMLLQVGHDTIADVVGRRGLDRGVT